jgi:urease
VTNALYGSFLPIPSQDLFPIPEAPTGPPPGAVICLKEKIKLNVGRKRWMVEVRNEGDRPIQVSMRCGVLPLLVISFTGFLLLARLLSSLSEREHEESNGIYVRNSPQVGSHYPFLETNASLVFDRLLSYGTHLDIPAGTAVRFEPGERKTVSLVEVGGKKLLSGGSGLGTGPFEEEARQTRVREAVEKKGFRHKKQDRVEEGVTPEMDREVVSGA